MFICGILKIGLSTVGILGVSETGAAGTSGCAGVSGLLYTSGSE